MTQFSSDEGDLVALFDALLGVKRLRFEQEFKAPLVSTPLIEFLFERCAKALLWQCVQNGIMRPTSETQRYADTLPDDWLRFGDASSALIKQLAHNAGLFMGSVRLRNEQSVGKRWAKKFVNSRCQTIGDELLFTLVAENLEKTYCKEDILFALLKKIVSLSALSSFIFAPRYDTPALGNERGHVVELLAHVPDFFETRLAQWPQEFERHKTPVALNNAFMRAARTLNEVRTAISSSHCDAFAPLFRGLNRQLLLWHSIDDLRLHFREKAKAKSVKEGESIGAAALGYLLEIMNFYDERERLSHVTYVDEGYERAQRFIGVFDENMRFERHEFELMLRQLRGAIH